MIRRWWDYTDGELRKKPLQTILWFLLGHVIVIAHIALGGAAILLLLTGNSSWTKVFAVVAGCAFASATAQVAFYKWLYPPMDGGDGPGGRKTIPFRKRDVA